MVIRQPYGLTARHFQVDNTDFEGRLILVDAMWYAQQTCKPRALLDMATLTCESRGGGGGGGLTASLSRSRPSLVTSHCCCSI